MKIPFDAKEFSERLDDASVTLGRMADAAFGMLNRENYDRLTTKCREIDKIRLMLSHFDPSSPSTSAGQRGIALSINAICNMGEGLDIPGAGSGYDLVRGYLNEYDWSS